MGYFNGNSERLAKYLELLLMQDEASPVAYQSKSSFYRIHVILTTHCNLDCVWCHRREEHLQDYLDREIDYSKLVDLLPQLQGFEMIHWAGLGEPLLYRKIYEATQLARKYIPNVMITTNGTLLTPEVCDKLIQSGLTHIEVSIDGFDGNANERYRGSSVNKVIKYLEYISNNSSISIQINSVLTNLNYEALFDAIDHLKGIRNIDCIHTIPLFMTKYMIDNEIRVITDDQHKELLKHWHNKIGEYGLNIKLRPDTTETQVVDPIIIMKRRHNICFSIYEDPIINIDGYIVPCGRLQHISLENVLEKGFDDAWNGPLCIKWRQEQLNGIYDALCERECYMKNTVQK